MVDSTTNSQLIAEASLLLVSAGAASPLADARLLLAHLLDVAPGQLLFTPAPTASQQAAYLNLLEQRASGVPVQHLTGQAWFRHVELSVGPGVFIPRPETESVAGAAIDEASRLTRTGVANPLVVDLGTGSGAIAKAIADEVPAARVVAVERDPGALDYAKRNLAGTGVTLLWADLAEMPASVGDLGPDGSVHVLVSNPPYLPTGRRGELSVDVRDHDPHAALFGGADGLDVIRVLEGVARRLLRDQGLVVVEHDDSHEQTAPELFESVGCWFDVTDHRDLTGRPRWLTARLRRTALRG